MDQNFGTEYDAAVRMNSTELDGLYKLAATGSDITTMLEEALDVIHGIAERPVPDTIGRALTFEDEMRAKLKAAQEFRSELWNSGS